jgi:hypothetical protein
MTTSLETHIYQSVRSMNDIIRAARQPLIDQNEKLRESLGVAALHIGLAKVAVLEGKLREADRYLELAEEAAGHGTIILEPPRALARLGEIAALAALDPDDLAAANELLDRIHAMAAKE